MKPAQGFRIALESMLALFVVSCLVSVSARMMTASSDTEVFLGYLMLAAAGAAAIAGGLAVFNRYQRRKSDAPKPADPARPHDRHDSH